MTQQTGSPATKPMSGARVFVDTNVLLYSVDPRTPEKQKDAQNWLNALWGLGCGNLSWQVLHEFYANASRKAGTPSETAREIVRTYSTWNPESPSLAALMRSWYWQDEARINFWDAMIVSAAEHAGCRWLLTEDLQADQKFDGLTVINPFARRPEDVLI